MSNHTGLYWFRKDLRLQDNASLNELCRTCDNVVFVYIKEDDVDTIDDVFSLPQRELVGSHKSRFVNEALVDLQTQLTVFGQTLQVISPNKFAQFQAGQSVSKAGYSRADIISHIICKLNIKTVASEWHSGVNEQKEWLELKAKTSNEEEAVSFIDNNSGLLYTESAFPFSLENLPQNFSPFRRKVEKYAEVVSPNGKISKLPPSPVIPPSIEAFLTKASISEQTKAPTANSPTWHGGETVALAQLHYYLWESDLITEYKMTRNGLDGWDFSSKLSAWLAHGCISPRRIYAEIKRYEEERTANDSTYWLFFELLWREFFHWHLLQHGKTLFNFDGVQQQSPSTRLVKSEFLSWVEGETGYKIVDACMKQLKQTGFMSNRGRQLVASCLVHELYQDWRYGAAYFEYQLIDFDVASNYGNWQYLAGVGADPRGHRQFNLEKQTQTYDPQHTFIRHYLG